MIPLRSIIDTHPQEPLANHHGHLEENRRTLLYRLTLLMTLIGTTPIVLRTSEHWEFLSVPNALYIMLLFATFSRRLRHEFRSCLVIAIFYTITVYLHVSYGIIGIGGMFGALTVVLASLLLNLRFGITVFLAIVVTIGCIGFLFVRDVFQVHPSVYQMSTDPLRWVLSTFWFALTTGIMIYAMMFLMRALNQQSKLLLVQIEKSEASRIAEQESIANYRLLAENIRDVIWTMDFDGKITYISPSVEKVRGIAAKDLLGKGIDETGPRSNAALFRQALELEFELERSEDVDLNRSRTLNMQLYHADGSLRDVEIVTSFLRDSRHIPVGILGVTRDVTERKKLEEQLTQSKKMELVGQLAGGVAHDFNNLLQAILGYSELAMMSVDDTSKVHSDIQHVFDAGVRAKVLVQQLLAFSRQQVLELSNLDINRVVRDVFRILKPGIGDHIEVSFMPGADVGLICADHGQLDQIIMNLCFNARDAMEAGGLLTITTSNVSFDDSFCRDHPWARPGRYVQLCVKDSGDGMDELTQSHMFEPFFTTKEQGKGTGLGLATVLGIVRQHGGLIAIESELNVGTEIKVLFPLVRVATMVPVKQSTVPVQTGAETLLVVDDEELVLDVAEAILSGAGYTILKARDGEEAIRVFDQHRSDIQLAIVDVVMPRIGGEMVAEHIQSVAPGVPVLLCTGYSGDSIQVDNDAGQGIKLIHKPYHRDELLGAVRSLLDRFAPDEVV